MARWALSTQSAPGGDTFSFRACFLPPLCSASFLHTEKIVSDKTDKLGVFKVPGPLLSPSVPWSPWLTSSCPHFPRPTLLSSHFRVQPDLPISTRKCSKNLKTESSPSSSPRPARLCSRSGRPGPIRSALCGAQLGPRFFAFPDSFFGRPRALAARSARTLGFWVSGRNWGAVGLPENPLPQALERLRPPPSDCGQAISRPPRAEAWGPSSRGRMDPRRCRLPRGPSLSPGPSVRDFLVKNPFRRPHQAAREGGQRPLPVRQPLAARTPPAGHSPGVGTPSPTWPSAAALTLPSPSAQGQDFLPGVSWSPPCHQPGSTWVQINSPHRCPLSPGNVSSPPVSAPLPAHSAPFNPFPA